MDKIARFHKVSKAQYEADAPGRDHSAIVLPRRATVGSAGYDFFAPFSFSLAPGESITVPTGVRAEIADGWVLCCFPRSGLGCRFRLQLDNTVGIIDADYFHADNEGHILIKLTNDTHERKTVSVEAGQGFAQGIFLPFGITLDDDAAALRRGGFGSTTKES